MISSEHRFVGFSDADGGQAPSVHLTSGKPGIADEERVSNVVGWHVDPLLDLMRSLDPPLGEAMARLAVLRLIPMMSGKNAEDLLKALARQVIETRNSKDSQSK